MRNKMPFSTVLDKCNGGIKMRVYPSQNYHDLAFAAGRSEPKTLSFAIKNLKDGELFIDVGANVGFITIPVAASNKKVTCIAIEPNPIAFDRLLFNVNANSLSNVICYPLAIGEQYEESWIGFPAKRNMGSASIFLGHEKKSIAIKVAPLESVLVDYVKPQIGCIKVDVEGYEDRVLMPLLQNMEKNVWPRSVVIEHKHRNYWKEDCIDFMTSNGYCQIMVDRADTFLQRE